jgi:hypothetical protein
MGISLSYAGSALPRGSCLFLDGVKMGSLGMGRHIRSGEE